MLSNRQIHVRGQGYSPLKLQTLLPSVIFIGSCDGAWPFWKRGALRWEGLTDEVLIWGLFLVVWEA